ACGFRRLSSRQFLALQKHGTRMSREPADRNVCATGWFMGRASVYYGRLSGTRQFFQIRTNSLVRRTVVQHLLVRLDSPVLARVAINVRPPVAMLGEAL